MADEISILSDGTAEAAYNTTPAWHKLGKVFTGIKCTSEVMSEGAHLGWNVVKEPLFFRRNGVEIPLRSKVVTVRDDFNTELGVVSPDYSIVQNADAFRFLDTLVMDGVMEYESAMALKGGRIVVVVARMPSATDEILPGDVSHRYVMFLTSHDGSMKLIALPTNVRVVCMNTVRMALAANDTVIEGLRHSGDMQVKLEELHNMVSQFDRAFTKFRDNGRLLAKAKITDRALAEKYLNSLFPAVKAPAPGEVSKSFTIREKKIAAIRRNFTNTRNTIGGTVDRGGMAGSWWGLVNAVTELVDHGDEMRYIGQGRERAENKFLNVTNGPGDALKQRAYSLACEAVGLQTA